MNGKITLTPDSPSLDARDLDQLIALWLEDLAGAVAAETHAGYSWKIQHFRDWWTLEGPKAGWILQQRDVERFARDLEEKPSARNGAKVLSYHTRNDVHRRLRQMFRWAYQNGYTAGIDYSHWVPAAVGSPPDRKAIGVKELARLIRAAERSYTPTRDKAIMAVLIGTGMRRSECAGLRAENIQFAADGSGVAEIMGKRTKANKLGKRQVAFDAHAGAYLKEWLDTANIRFGPIWRGPGGRPLTPQGLYKVVKKIIAAAGLEGALDGCHDLRRAFATYLARQVESATDADVLRRQMGHTSYSMTAHYSLLDAEDLRQRLRSPMSAL